MTTRGRHSVTRRSFLGTSTAALAAALSACRTGADFSRPRALGPNDRVNVAVIGAGGRGADNLDELANAGANIVALCDCDEARAAESFAKHPEARRFGDWRRLFDEPDLFDAVAISTPDHNHAVIAIAAMRLGKHVYCEKPLARTIWEAREMARVARESGVATQMGTQGHSYEGTRRAVETLRAGTIGEVRELHVWTDRPAGWWPQGIGRPAETPPVPPGLDWDVWLGPAPERPYSPAYVPFAWRGFWDFGTGAIGDMGIHTLDTAFWGLQLGAPTAAAVKDCSPALADPRMTESAPLWSVIELQFPAGDLRPPLTMTWYDGGKLPPEELFQGEPRISTDGGSLVIGSKGTLFTRTWHGGLTDADMFVLLPRREFDGWEPPSPALPRTPGHHREWLDACRGVARAQSPFEYAALLTESLLVGNLALRTGEPIRWNAGAMRVEDRPEAEPLVHPTFRQGWTI